MEGGSLAHLTLYAYLSMHGIHHLLHYGQTHACAYVLRVRLALIERIEGIGDRLFVHPFACVAHFHVQDVPCAPQRNVDLAVFGRELEGVGEQIAQHLMDVVGHEVHRHRLLHIQLQIDVSASRIFAVRIHYHRHIAGDAAVAPVQIAHL